MQGFEKLIKLFCRNEVEFVMIGGFAAVVHGVSVLTQDVDFAISFDCGNLKKILVALEGSHPIHRQNRKPLAGTISSGSNYNNLYLITDFGPVDLLGEVSGIGPFEEVAKHAIEIELFGERCRVLNIDALIRSKREMKRPKDKETIIQLKAIKEKMV